MSTKINFSNLSHENTNSTASSLAYPTTAVSDFNDVHIYEIINGVDSMFCDSVKGFSQSFVYPQGYVCREKIILNDEDYTKVKDHVESVVIDNPKLKNLFAKYNK